ncbi:MAG: UvrD-helicase domain-containing protein [Deltaproteobacteria bacterium]
MSFGPFTLKNSYIQDGNFILELADSEGIVRFRPKRFVSFSRHQIVYAKAKQLQGHLVTTETSNPSKNPPEQWWIDVKEYHAAPNTVDQVIYRSEHKYTEEQQSCIEKFQAVNHLKISALAGTGKTTTLYGIANYVPSKRGLYLAFNKEIAEYARKKFNQNVECRTTHSLAYEFSANRYSTEKLTGGANSIRVTNFLKLEPVSFGEHKNFSERQVGQWVLDTFRGFCQSDSMAIDRQHVACGRLRQIGSSDEVEGFEDYLVQCADYIWQHARDPSSQFPLGHDGYLKLWSISNPSFEKDFIMLDEAQDTNEAVIHALTSQSVKTVYVGDKYQQIYGFRGAFNAMDKIKIESESALTTSFRFGDAIAEIANAIILRFGESRRIVGNQKVTSTVNKSTATTFIYRTNMGVLDGLADQLKQNKKPYLIGGTKDLEVLVYDIELMQSGQMAISNTDFFGFKNWLDLVNYSKLNEGHSYRTVVQLVEMYGIQQIKQMIKGVTLTRDDANVILTTAHKSKGREWGHVQLGDDFATERRIKNIQVDSYSFKHPMVEEITLLYVALTRAKLSLNIPDLILEVFNLDKYFRNPMSTKKVSEVGHDAHKEFVDPISPAIVRPELPKKFKFSPPVTLPVKTTISEGGLANKSIKSSPTHADKKLQALIEKFKK